MIIQLRGSHLVLQVILSVHLMVGHVKVVIGVVVLKHTAGGEREEESTPIISDIEFSCLRNGQQVRTYNSLIPYGPTR